MISLFKHQIYFDVNSRKGKINKSNLELTSKEHFEKRVNEQLMNENIIVNRVRIFRNYSIGGVSVRSKNEKMYKERCLNPNDFQSKLSKSYIYKAERKYSSFSDDKGASGMLTISPETNTEQLESLEKKVLFLTKKKEMITNIINQRKKAVNKIIKAFRKYINVIKENKKFIIEQLLNKRIDSSKNIQKNFKSYIVRKHINELRKDYDFVFFYNYIDKGQVNDGLNKTQDNKTQDNNDMVSNSSNYNNRLKIKEIKLKFGRNGNEYQFKYSEVLQIYYLAMKKNGVMRKRFKVNFIVNGMTIIDPRYEVDNDRNGYFYNIIESNMFWKKINNPLPMKPLINENKKKSKFWENIFEIKIRSNNSSQAGTSSVSDISEYNDAFIDKLLTNNRAGYKPSKSNIELKPILKPRSSYKSVTSTTISSSSGVTTHSGTFPPPMARKQVSFNDYVQFTY